VPTRLLAPPNMKRVADELDRDSKRVKRAVDYTAIFSDPAQEKNAADLPNGPLDGSGYVSGTIRMKWDFPKTKPRISVETGANLKHFEVEFTSRAAEAVSAGVSFKGTQQVHISLRGAELVRKTVGSAVNMLPFRLKYSEGVALEILPLGREPGLKLDTWAGE
jgi:hypothetical protein